MIHSIIRICYFLWRFIYLEYFFFVTSFRADVLMFSLYQSCFRKLFFSLHNPTDFYTNQLFFLFEFFLDSYSNQKVVFLELIMMISIGGYHYQFIVKYQLDQLICLFLIYLAELKMFFLAYSGQQRA